MAMQGIHFMGEVPWKTMYLHGLVRAADGSKMSKSKGNTVDPLGLIDQYGADALRFFMAAMESQGRDIKMDESRVAGYRNFATKLWNAARFLQGNGVGASQSVRAPDAALAVNKWIIGEVVETLTKLDKAFTEFRFDAMADAIYHFVWNQFCDWYLELIKPAFVDGEKQDMDTESMAVAGWVLDQILVMLHPFMPFVTEELWHAMGDRSGHMLIHAQWPEPEAVVDFEAKAEIGWLVKLVSELRTAKAELGISPATRTNIVLGAPMLGEELEDRLGEHKERADVRDRFSIHHAAIHRLGRIDFFWLDYSPQAIDMATGKLVEMDMASSNSSSRIQIVVDGLPFSVPLEGIIDLDAERARITKAIEAATKERDALASRLSNAAFVEKAKPEAVEKARADHAEKADEAERLTAALDRLG